MAAGNCSEAFLEVMDNARRGCRQSTAEYCTTIRNTQTGGRTSFTESEAEVDAASAEDYLLYDGILDQKQPHRQTSSPSHSSHKRTPSNLHPLNHGIHQCQDPPIQIRTDSIIGSKRQRQNFQHPRAESSRSHCTYHSPCLELHLQLMLRPEAPSVLPPFVYHIISYHIISYSLRPVPVRSCLLFSSEDLPS